MATSVSRRFNPATFIPTAQNEQMRSLHNTVREALFSTNRRTMDVARFKLTNITKGNRGMTGLISQIAHNIMMSETLRSRL